MNAAGKFQFHSICSRPLLKIMNYPIFPFCCILCSFVATYGHKTDDPEQTEALLILHKVLGVSATFSTYSKLHNNFVNCFCWILLTGNQTAQMHMYNLGSGKIHLLYLNVPATILLGLITAIMLIIMCISLVVHHKDFHTSHRSDMMLHLHTFSQQYATAISCEEKQLTLAPTQPWLKVWDRGYPI